MTTTTTSTSPIPSAIVERRRRHRLTSSLTVAARLIPVARTGLALTVVATGLVATTNSAVASARPADRPDPIHVDGELSLLVDDVFKRPTGTGALAGPSGQPGVFVVGELVVHSNDPAVAVQLAKQHDGNVVETVEPPEQLSADATAATLVQINPDRADISTVLEDLSAIGGEAAHGEHIISDEAALATLAAAARARAEGIVVDINWVAETETIRTGTTTEAPRGRAGNNPNSFTWSQLTDLNVPPAWDLLARAGLLRPNSVPIAVIDQGFAPVDADRPAGISDAPRLGNGCGGICPQHGANVASTVAAAVDNRFGGAGTAGPVARTILIDVGATLNSFTIQVAQTRAISAGARIINMSLSGSVPEISSSLVGGFNAFTASVRGSGILQFAAAGNFGVDVDARTCFFGCWESDVFFPCELAGVICVGGIDGNGSRLPASGSNFGSGGFDPTATVELWGDFCALVGPDLVTPGNITKTVCGTSFATPAVAGVAALLRAVSVDANVVESTLLATSPPGGCTGAGRCARGIPDARAATSRLLGNQPPDLDITATSPVWDVARGDLVSFSATASDSDGPSPLVISWFVDGVPTGVTGPTFSSRFFGQSFGLHAVTATATDGRWTVPDGQAGIVVKIANTAPSVSITSPTQGATFTSIYGWSPPCGPFSCPDQIALTADTADRNNSPSRLPDTNVSWYLDGASTAFATGHQATLAASTLALGTHTITVRAADTDDGGLVSRADVTISIVRPTPHQP